MADGLRVKADAVRGDPLWDCANEVSRLRERLEKAEAVVEAARVVVESSLTPDGYQTVASLKSVEKLADQLAAYDEARDG